ncbi:endolytic transglycosylase MltG [Murimonas intestini]|uniref:endolytic transglycosylase MltG n=1 Tax=Murimonas intestini TaxID=1337051 RepID=UPI0016523097|nr:endolytic transglycosylase MltG [Murimonas intestini]
MKTKNTASAILFTILKIVILVLIVLALIAIGKKAYDFGYKVFAQETVSDPPGKDVVVTIPDGMDAGDVGKLLEEKRLILDADVFRVQEFLSKYHNKIKPGTYTLNNSWSADMMLEVISGTDETESESET